jgi:predicted dinucleotide-binding enzyme
VVVDITNPVNETFDDLVTPPDSSAAQQIASSVPGARVVKLRDEIGQTLTAVAIEAGSAAHGDSELARAVRPHETRSPPPRS